MDCHIFLGFCFFLLSCFLPTSRCNINLLLHRRPISRLRFRMFTHSTSLQPRFMIIIFQTCHLLIICLLILIFIYSIAHFLLIFLKLIGLLKVLISLNVIHCLGIVFILLFWGVRKVPVLISVRCLPFIRRSLHKQGVFLHD